MGQVGDFRLVGLTLLEFLGLAGIPVLHGAVVTGDTAIDLGGFAALGAGELLTIEVTVVLADRIGGGDGVIGELVVFGDLSHQVCCGFPARQLLAQEGVEDGAGGVAGLEIVLNVESGKDIVRVSDGEMRGVGVIGRSAGLCSGDDVGIELNIMLGETVGGGLGRGRLEIEEVAVLFLIVAEAFPHVIEHLLGELHRAPAW